MQKTDDTLFRSNSFKGALFGLLAAVIWGAWPVVSKLAANDQLNGWDLTALRFGIAGCLLLPVFIRQMMKVKEMALKSLVLAMGAGAPYSLLATSGLTFAPSAHFGIIAPSSMLVFVTLGSFLWLRESLKASRILGILLILSGVVFVAGHSLGELSANTAADTIMGDLMFVGCGLLWASYTLLAKHWQISPWTATAMVAVASMVIYLPVYFFAFDAQRLLASVDTLIWQGLFQGVLTAIAALYFYSKAVALLGSGKGAVFSALVPPIALLLGASLLGETITWVEYAGLGLVCFGMLFALEVVRLPGSSMGITSWGQTRLQKQV